jgi:hypothetical protein
MSVSVRTGWLSGAASLKPSFILQVSEKSGKNGNFNYFSYFYLHVKVKS